MRRKVVIVDHREEGFEMENKAYLSEDTEESIVNLHQEVIDDVLRVLSGNVPQNVVNY